MLVDVLVLVHLPIRLAYIYVETDKVDVEILALLDAHLLVLLVVHLLVLLLVLQMSLVQEMLVHSLDVVDSVLQDVLLLVHFIVQCLCKVNIRNKE